MRCWISVGGSISEDLPDVAARSEVAHINQSGFTLQRSPHRFLSHTAQETQVSVHFIATPQKDEINWMCHFWCIFPPPFMFPWKMPSITFLICDCSRKLQLNTENRLEADVRQISSSINSKKCSLKRSRVFTLTSNRSHGKHLCRSDLFLWHFCSPDYCTHTHTCSSTVQPDIGYSRETVTFDTEQWQDWLLQVNGRRW